MVAGGDGIEVLGLLEIEKGAIAEATPGPFATRGVRYIPIDSQEVEGNSEFGTEGLAE